MSLYTMFQTNKATEQQGILLEYGQTADGKPIRIRIARAGGNNAKFQKILETRTKPYRRQIQNETMDPKLAEEVFMGVYAECIVLGWENVTDAAGQTLEFSKENCLKLFKELPDLFVDVREQSNKMALFQAETREVDSKNS